ncbi:hypothetical protein HPP92_012030 [Vanilla planifolia]|uniref:Ionotropic glutamate receptor C-terminal domain-containing protein n=1 Tax=Vanilla planifolia TaxID=51239 RepID=A0A835R762_VANPL|nr:hypothetical protein HPP92_012030 [Vanilla planifolia]
MKTQLSGELMIAEDEVKSNLTKIVVSFWLFAVLILTSSYTASLSSMLTVQQLRPTATNVEDLIRSGTSIGYMGDLTSTDKQGIDKSRLKAYYSKEEFNDALSRGSSHGGVSAIIAETPYLKAFLSKYCNNYTMIGPVYKTNGFGFAFSKGSPLVNDISREMTRLSGDIENLFYKSMDECSNNSTVAVKERLAVGSFSGLFLITGLTSAVALLLYISQVMYKQTKASPPLHEPSLR